MIIKIIVEGEHGELVRQYHGDYELLHVQEWNEKVREMLDVIHEEDIN